MSAIAQLVSDYESKQNLADEAKAKLLAALQGNSTVVTATATKPVVKGKRGRPAGSKNAGVVVVGNEGKKENLPDLLTRLAAESKAPLSLPEFVKLADESGYKTKAKNFSNMIYQCLLKLVKKNVFAKDDDNQNYRFVGKAA